jgi:hypothetical protein
MMPTAHAIATASVAQATIGFGRLRRSGWDAAAGDTGRHRSAHGRFGRTVIASTPMPSFRATLSGLALTAVTALAVAACGTISTTPPAPTPADFQGIATELTKRGIAIDDLVSGDAGCSDPVLVPTAIGITAKGIDQAEPVRMYLYIFRNRDSYDRLRLSIDACARSFVTDPQTFASVERSPFVIAGQGPWAPQFEAAIRDALTVAAGTGD